MVTFVHLASTVQQGLRYHYPAQLVDTVTVQDWVNVMNVKLDIIVRMELLIMNSTRVSLATTVQRVTQSFC